MITVYLLLKDEYIMSDPAKGDDNDQMFKHLDESGDLEVMAKLHNVKLVSRKYTKKDEKYFLDVF